MLDVCSTEQDTPDPAYLGNEALTGQVAPAIAEQDWEDGIESRKTTGAYDRKNPGIRHDRAAEAHGYRQPDLDNGRYHVRGSLKVEIWCRGPGG